MQPAMKKNVPVRVKNSYNPEAVGTIIEREKSDQQRLVTAITYKKGVTVLDICSTQMLGAYGFLARVFGEFEKHKLSVDVLASSEVSVSLTLDKRQDSDEIDVLIADLSEVSNVVRKDGYGILTLIADVDKSSEVLATAFRVFSKEQIRVEMMSQGASKVNISFIVPSEQLERAINELHSRYFDDDRPVSSNSNSNNRRRNRRTDHGWTRPKVRPTDTGSINSSSNTIMKTSSQPPRVVSDEELVQYAYNTIFR